MPKTIKKYVKCPPREGHNKGMEATIVLGLFGWVIRFVIACKCPI